MAADLQGSLRYVRQKGYLRQVRSGVHILYRPISLHLSFYLVHAAAIELFGQPKVRQLYQVVPEHKHIPGCKVTVNNLESKQADGLTKGLYSQHYWCGADTSFDAK